MDNRYCSICDNKIERKKVDDRLTYVCMKCSRITGGYKKSEESFVKRLRASLCESNYYEIDSIILILRNYLDEIRRKETNVL